MQVTLGGERLGSGKKEKVYLRNYERSTHDLSYIWRSTMAAGTLVPFMSEVALPGDTFDIKLNTSVLTHPTIGPLFGSYKVQLDVFQIPIRLYQGQLHMNKLGIGLKMQNVKLPQLRMMAPNLDFSKDLDNQQVNPSSIFSYLNIRGLGQKYGVTDETEREFNAVPYLAYWDIYKNYYANKQEDEGFVIHNNLQYNSINEVVATFKRLDGDADYTIPSEGRIDPVGKTLQFSSYIELQFTDLEIMMGFDTSKLQIFLDIGEGGSQWYYIEDLFANKVINENNLTIKYYVVNAKYKVTNSWTFEWQIGAIRIKEPDQESDVEPRLEKFPLTNIDRMRELILGDTANPSAFIIDNESLIPYSLPLKRNLLSTPKLFSQLSSQEGLALKTYQSDLFNNWISTEWIDGDNGINEITKVNITDGSFTIDELMLSRKIYDMLNRIAISGGSYDDWLDATYTHERTRSMENPVYMGGLIKELTFEEVISNSATAEQPLGTLAGRGNLTGKHKGGYIKVKVDEPSYIIGIVSLTPRIDYSQGNKWDVNLKTMDDFHKPALDEIGFQDLITDQMAWWDTETELTEPIFKSAGKQPAWINYMTNVNQVRGNFAMQSQQMFMTLNRRYEPIITSNETVTIKDLTTYIDPTKFNHIFADTRRDAQNFWTQIKVDITARRKMSAKVMPNL